MKDKELAELLEEWFKIHVGDKRKNTNPVWKALKTYLSQSDNWKECARWYPKRFVVRKDVPYFYEE